MQHAITRTQACLLAALMWACPLLVQAQDRSKPDAVPEPALRTPHAKTFDDKVDARRFNLSQVVVKFHEGTGIRLRDGRLTVASPDPQALKGLGLDLDGVAQDIARVALLIDQLKLTPVRHFAGTPEEKVAANRKEAQALSGRAMPDLDLYYSLLRQGTDVATAQRIVRELQALKVVEVAYIQPIPKEAVTDIAPVTTFDLRPLQGYAGPAPNGIDAVFAKTQPGGRGEDIRIVDVEVGWREDHEDLPRIDFRHGIKGPDSNHGTAVLGVMAAVENNYGIDGLVPAAKIGWSSVIGASLFNPFYTVAAAINNATESLRAGDVLVIEQHYPGPVGNLRCNEDCGNCGQFGYVAMEYFPAEFDAIVTATARRMVVVEAAGNGQMNLGAGRYERRFDPQFRDSGAILVGAGRSGRRAPMCWTNFGQRVDMHGWGQNVATLGYGKTCSRLGGRRLRANGDDERQWYTCSFSGTSSATPIVASAAAAVQGMNKARRGETLSPVDVRQLLKTTGTPQSEQLRKNIGPLPDLRAAFNDLAAPTRDLGGVSRVAARVRSTGDIDITVDVRNEGGTVWAGSAGYRVKVSGDVPDQVLSFPEPVAPGAVATLRTSAVCQRAGDTRIFAQLLHGDAGIGGSSGMLVRCVVAN